MTITDRLNIRLISEQALDCKMFWCYPIPDDVGNPTWELLVLDSAGDDLSNWAVVIHKMKLAWKKDLSNCRGHASALPRGVAVDDVLYHGNNLPQQFPLREVAAKMGRKLGTDLTPKYHASYGIKLDDLKVLEGLLGVDLGLQPTD